MLVNVVAIKTKKNLLTAAWSVGCVMFLVLWQVQYLTTGSNNRDNMRFNFELKSTKGNPKHHRAKEACA